MHRKKALQKGFFFYLFIYFFFFLGFLKYADPSMVAVEHLKHAIWHVVTGGGLRSVVRKLDARVRQKGMQTRGERPMLSLAVEVCSGDGSRSARKMAAVRKSGAMASSVEKGLSKEALVDLGRSLGFPSADPRNLVNRLASYMEGGISSSSLRLERDTQNGRLQCRYGKKSRVSIYGTQNFYYRD
ncbi:hypothetical protein NE237_020856 [Protea cynaroides]|uniref:Uncharacterized protein n=1 Tax=Protea cynaroides TaxID=273540 RepID=A0A9Q0K2Q2_9MAGN|nr:hypothetical protein NE237_020856 [Protea cynaroides]